MIDLLDKEYPEHERPNKSLLKREAQAALELAKKLVELHEAKWLELGLPVQIVEELHILKNMPQHGAKKRQLKLVGKLLREVDTTLAVQAVESVVKSRAQDSVVFHRIERWRDKLLHDSDALTEFVVEYNGVDVQALRQLIRNAKQEAVKGKTTKSAKLLFKQLRDIIE